MYIFSFLSFYSLFIYYMTFYDDFCYFEVQNYNFIRISHHNFITLHKFL